MKGDHHDMPHKCKPTESWRKAHTYPPEVLADIDIKGRGSQKLRLYCIRVAHRCEHYGWIWNWALVRLQRAWTGMFVNSILKAITKTEPRIKAVKSCTIFIWIHVERCCMSRQAVRVNMDITGKNPHKGWVMSSAFTMNKMRDFRVCDVWIISVATPCGKTGSWNDPMFKFYEDNSSYV